MMVGNANGRVPPLRRPRARARPCVCVCAYLTLLYLINCADTRRFGTRIHVRRGSVAHAGLLLLNSVRQRGRLARFEVVHSVIVALQHISWSRRCRSSTSSSSSSSSAARALKLKPADRLITKLNTEHCCTCARAGREMASP